MLKNMIKILIVLSLASVLGALAIVYIPGGKQRYLQLLGQTISVLSPQATTGSDSNDVYSQSPQELLSGSITTNTGENVDSTVLEKRLEYYRSHKQELGIE